MALLAVQGLEYAVGRLGLVPVDIAGMVRSLVEVAGGMSIEDRSAKGGSFHRISVTAHGAVSSGENELELSGCRSSKDGDGIVAQAPPVLLHVFHDLVHVVRIVNTLKDLFDHRLLVGRVEPVDLVRRDRPVVVHLGTKGVIEGERHHLPLLLRQALVERGHQSLRIGRGFGCGC